MYDFLKVDEDGRDMVATGHLDVENIDLHWYLEEDLVSNSCGMQEGSY